MHSPRHKRLFCPVLPFYFPRQWFLSELQTIEGASYYLFASYVLVDMLSQNKCL